MPTSTPTTKPHYRRILLKLSGEMLTDTQTFGIHPRACHTLAKSIKAIRDTGVEIGIVIGGGNIFRGKDLESIGITRSPADLMGMLATLINGTALHEALENIGCPTKILTALECPKVADPYTWRAAMEILASGSVAIFVGGTGNPYFTTDTAAALRAAEIRADILFKATKVDGVYSKDPLKFPDAMRYDVLSYSQMLDEKLGVMDATAVALCRDNKIPIIVFNMHKLTSESASELLQKHSGSLISGE
ncbi:MAG: UMP kinase [Parachlamydiaceae bacterium]